MPSARRWARRWTNCSGKTEPRPCLKVFCPAFLQKSGRGPGAAPPVARRSARNAHCVQGAQEGRPRKSNENAAHSGGVFTISRIVTRARKIPRHAVRFPPVVGVGVLDDPFLRPPPAPRRRAGAAGGLGRPQRGNPGEGSPFNPLLRFISTREFRALRRAARAPPLDPARFFVKKRGKKLLLG